MLWLSGAPGFPALRCYRLHDQDQKRVRRAVALNDAPLAGAPCQIRQAARCFHAIDDRRQEAFLGAPNPKAGDRDRPVTLWRR